MYSLKCQSLLILSSFKFLSSAEWPGHLILAKKGLDACFMFTERFMQLLKFLRLLNRSQRSLQNFDNVLLRELVS
jgi:hypothetical protein